MPRTRMSKKRVGKKKKLNIHLSKNIYKIYVHFIVLSIL